MWSLKKLHTTDRPMTAPLFLLRCVQLGISIQDLDLLTIGMVNDMYAESSNDEYKGSAQIATQITFKVKRSCLCIHISLSTDPHSGQFGFLHEL